MLGIERRLSSIICVYNGGWGIVRGTYVIQLAGVPCYHMKDVGAEPSPDVLLLTHWLQTPLYQLWARWEPVQS
jgi:hypothetical protein